MNPDDKLVASIANTSNIEGLRTQIKNAKGRSKIVEEAAFNRLIRVQAAGEATDALALELWSMIFAVEEIRRQVGRKVWRMNRLRPKVLSEGAVAALTYLAINKSDGFDEVRAYGRDDLLAESIVIRHAERFDPDAVEAARRRLRDNGIIE